MRKLTLLLLLIIGLGLTSCSKDEDLQEEVIVDPYGENCGAQGCKIYVLKYYDAEANIHETTVSLKCGLDRHGTETADFINTPHSKETMFNFTHENRCNQDYGN